MPRGKTRRPIYLNTSRPTTTDNGGIRRSTICHLAPLKLAWLVNKDRRLQKGCKIKGLLNGPLPFDYIESDIPVWFVGQGTISDLFFSTPSRTEAKRILKCFDYEVISGRGKGSHEIWTGPDNRSFSLPLRDPLSRLVFTNLLNHLGINKETYLQEIRPHLI